MEVAADAHDGDLGVVVRTVQSLKSRMAAEEDRANTVKAPAREAVDKMSDLRFLVEEINRNIGSKLAHVEGLVHAEWVRVRSVITQLCWRLKARSASRYVACLMVFPVKTSSDAPGRRLGVLLLGLRSSSLYGLILLAF